MTRPDPAQTHQPANVEVSGCCWIVYVTSSSCAGCIMWTMWAGQVPWAGFTEPQIMMAASHGRGLAILSNAPADYQVLHSCWSHLQHALTLHSV